MGPITLFDKSFLQMLTVDESVWFDHFFFSNICPLFYIETLADLDKAAKNNRPAKDEVRIIANKFPECNSGLNIYHTTLCIKELLSGKPIPMQGSIVSDFDKLILLDNKIGAVANISPEAEAFMRWRKREFLEVEHQFACGWRNKIKNLDSKKISEKLELLGLNEQKCKTLEEAKELAEKTIISRENKEHIMYMALLFLNIPDYLHRDIHKCWSMHNYPPLHLYAPYSAYVLKIEVFYRLALNNQLISDKLSTNRIDIAYLFYLPFCMQFVSSDKFHQKCTPLFLRKDQYFIWGNDLKHGLDQLNRHYLTTIPASAQEKGISTFAHIPPKEEGFFVAELWDRHFPNWRSRKYIDPDEKNINSAEIAGKINAALNARPLVPCEVSSKQTHDLDTITMKSAIQKKKGSWFLVSKSFMGEYKESKN